jgi:hypothetical protein
MAQTTRQSNLLVNQDWTKVYQAFTNADFTSYDFETLRNSMINYLTTYYPETFNDFLESSEYLALIDMIAFLGQSLSFRVDLNARENFIDTAQRRDSILKLARMLSYNPTRNVSATGLLKFDSISTTETIYDSNGNNLANTTISWNDPTNDNWLEQFTAIMNASLVTNQAIGKPGNSQVINNIQIDEYSIQLDPTLVPIAPFSIPVQSVSTNFEAVSATTLGKTYIYERDPTITGQFNVLYQNDNNGNGSNNTGFFTYFKQGSLQASNFNIQNAVPNNYVPITTNNINNTDAWLYSLDVNGNPNKLWEQVPALPGINVVFNQLSSKELYQVNTQNNDQVTLVFGDGTFAAIPQGNFNFYYRTGNGLTYSITPDDMSFVNINLAYMDVNGGIQVLTITASLKYTVTNATAAQSTESVKTYAPQQYYTQNRMITGEDYQIFPLTNYTSIQKVKAVNRISSGVSLYLDTLDTTGTFSTTNIFGDDGIIAANTTTGSGTFSFLTTNDIYSAIYNDIVPVINSTEMNNYYYANYPRLNSPHANIKFFQAGNTTSSSWGNLVYNGTVQQLSNVGNVTYGNLGYVDTGALLKFDTGYAAVTNVVGNTTVYFGNVVANGSVLGSTTSIIPTFKNDLTSSVITVVAQQIANKVNFGLTYDQVNQIWVNIPPSQIGTNNTWLLKFTYNAGLYSILFKKLTYTFMSAGQTQFYFDPTVKVFDSASGNVINDIIKILKINSQPSSSNPIGNDVMWNIYGVIAATDGFVDPTQVLVKSPETQLLGVPDNPDLYTTVANVATSRDSLYFQYKHNSPSNNRIDPTSVNLVDLYLLTAQYSTDYINWLRDLTGTVVEPTRPTSSSLEIAYSGLENFKTKSDTLIFNPAQFKPLFGAKADPSLQARFQVVVNPAVSITANEVKSQVINAINQYFDIAFWDFGDTFYFSELAAFLHTQLVPTIASVLIVPANDNLVFGNYFQINAEPWEIITSAATVNDVDIISAVTAAQLNLGNNIIGTF